jgi:soluble lytic murein transglycosylase
VQAAEPVFHSQPPSPLAGRAAVLVARALLESGNPKGALNALARAPEPSLPQPDSLWVRARAHEASGAAAAAAIDWQRLYCRYPLSDQASDAATALARLEPALGANYPPLPSALLFERAERFLATQRWNDARSEYNRIIGLVDGPDRELARVRLGAAAYRARRNDDAFSWLTALNVESPEADAERLYWLAATARRLNKDNSVDDALAALAQRAPRSDWRLRTLTLAGDNFLVENAQDSYLRYYRACADIFPSDPRAAYCHWKLVWAACLRRSNDARTLLRQHLERYPASEKAGAALFWLARLAKEERDYAAARAWYEEVLHRFPNYFYAVLAREELRQADVARAVPSAEIRTYLSSIHWPRRERDPDFTADAESARRIARARLLRQADLDDWAEGELRYGARNGGSTWALAMEMAESAAARGAHAQSIRYILGTVPGYLFLPRDEAPLRFWRLAFPFPYRPLIEKYARANGLDPFLLAALIRQESLFDPAVVSYAGAIGLTQVLPSTGRSLARRLRIRYRTASLKTAAYNLRLGTYYLKNLIADCNGRIEDALAAYNAGMNRVTEWRGWAQFRDDPEFIETIPFTQTRDYVQIILRNADIYRWLYAGTASPAQPKPAVKKSTTSKKAAPAKSSTKKRKASVKRRR